MNTLSVDIQNRVNAKVVEVYTKAQVVFNKNFTIPTIEYCDMGKTAGRAWSSKNLIQLSPTLLTENTEHFLKSTVPHEISHLLTRTLFVKATSHGRHWKHVMIKLGVNPNRCHTYDVSNVVNLRNVKKYNYSCKCQTHVVSKTIHNRVVSGKIYRCKRCFVPISMVCKKEVSVGNLIGV